jgi:hypothetical protein
VQTSDGRVVDVDGVETREGSFEVYNFKVDGFPTYFVSELGVLVHNVCRYDVIQETMDGRGNITSSHIITADDALDTAIVFLGDGYREIGRPGSGVFRSADDLRQFRIDNNSLLGNHAPDVPHLHFETYAPSARNPSTNNHIPFTE